MASSEVKKCDEWPLLSPADTLKQKEEKLGGAESVWEFAPDDGVQRLRRRFTAKNFQAALDFIALAGATAEKRGHHPDFHLTSYRNVEVVVYTHSLKGLTENDFLLAREIDECKVLYSPKWLRQHPHAQRTAL